MSQTETVTRPLMEQLPNQYRVDFDTCGERPPNMLFGIVLTVTTIERYAIKQGWYDPDIAYADNDARINAQTAGAEAVRTHLEAVIGHDGKYPSVHFDYAEFPQPEGDVPWSFVLVLYGNRTPAEGLMSDTDEKFALDFLREELDLTDEEAKPMWYFQFSDW